uniref:Uncharacterized protein n=1 Tax=Meloidogyne enterolobii TaxID=390850 RepID=A0A6V7WYX4_MELEN|nr:unnamed protein product [Meloidogyne enterolobii]
MEEQFILNNFDKENPNNLFLFNDHLTKQNDFNGSHCSLKFLQISIWFVTVLDIVLAILAIILNSLLIPSSLNSRPIPFRTRRFLSSISLNYALLASILLTKKCFWLYFSFVNPKGHCIPTFTSSTCKLQEFPLVFIYIYSMILPLIFALQMAFKRWFRKNKEEEKIINFNNQRKIIIQNSSRQSRRFFV